MRQENVQILLLLGALTSFVFAEPPAYGSNSEEFDINSISSFLDDDTSGSSQVSGKASGFSTSGFSPSSSGAYKTSTYPAPSSPNSYGELSSPYTPASTHSIPYYTGGYSGSYSGSSAGSQGQSSPFSFPIHSDSSVGSGHSLHDAKGSATKQQNIHSPSSSSIFGSQTSSPHHSASSSSFYSGQASPHQSSASPGLYGQGVSSHSSSNLSPSSPVGHSPHGSLSQQGPQTFGPSGGSAYPQVNGYEGYNPYNSPGASYNGPSASYNGPSASYNGPSALYNAPSAPYNSPSASSFNGPSGSYSALHPGSTPGSYSPYTFEKPAPGKPQGPPYASPYSSFPQYPQRPQYYGGSYSNASPALFGPPGPKTPYYSPYKPTGGYYRPYSGFSAGYKRPNSFDSSSTPPWKYSSSGSRYPPTSPSSPGKYSNYNAIRPSYSSPQPVYARRPPYTPSNYKGTGPKTAFAFTDLF